MVHEIRIPNWRPATFNDLKDNRWAAAKLKKIDRELVAAYAIQAGVPKATGRRRVSLRVVLAKGQRAPDEDAFNKSLWDALKQAGMLVDDNRNWCRAGDVEYLRSRDGSTSTTIILEDVAPAPKIRKLKKGEVA